MGVTQVSWKAVDKPVSGLATNASHQVQVQREAIPIIFVPGVMGSRLRLAGTNGTGQTAGLPNLRWDPTAGFLYSNYSGVTPAHRKAMLIGDSPAYDPNYLEVDNDSPPGNGYRGLMDKYRGYLEELRTHDWGALGKLFVFPVYGFGYNWSASNRTSGAKLAARIDEIIAEGKKHAGACEKVILVTHSMGGLVARSAMKLHGAEGKVLGVVHGVQPAYGAAAAYNRMKAGFEGSGIEGTLTSRFLGPTGRDVTALLANSIGGLQLLPGKHYLTSHGSPRWLEVPHPDAAPQWLPHQTDPFNDIYRVPAVVSPEAGKGQTNNTYWGLVDPALLTPKDVETKTSNSLDDKSDDMLPPDAAWKGYLANLAEAEAFLDELGTYRHPKTWWFNGGGLTTAETSGYDLESNWMRSDSYPTRGFRGFLRGPDGSKKQAILKEADGTGDGTVPIMSSSFNGSLSPPPAPPANRTFPKLAHQPAYENDAVQTWATAAITAIAGLYVKQRHG
jgi:pimeloyl-ACP methyl ester carboxylesterase